MRTIAKFEYANVVIRLVDNPAEKQRYQWSKHSTTIVNGMFVRKYAEGQITHEIDVARKWFEQSVRSLMFELKTENIFT